jgi:predicted polyphosphate/ATP-dependent NAD kinase
MGSYQKIGILKRVIMALDWAGVEEILIMPDRDSLGRRAAEDLCNSLKARVEIIDLPINNEADDSMKAAAFMVRKGVSCIVTMGGDGTNRIVARACGETPLVPISTGTNNVFPFMVEGTTAGLAAGIVARGLRDPESCLQVTKKLNIIKNGRVIDLALIDAVIVDQQFIGARAIWDLSLVREIVSTQAHPSFVGMASIGGSFHPVTAEEDLGLYLRIGENGFKVNAAIAPGMIREVGIADYRVLALGDRVPIKVSHMVIIALDGEREVEIRPDDQIEIELVREGPRVVKIKETLETAARAGFFISAECPKA